MHYIGFQGALAAVDKNSPGVVGVGGWPPATVLPMAVKVGILEDSGLGIGGIGPAVDIHKNTAVGANFLWPAQVE